MEKSISQDMAEESEPDKLSRKICDIHLRGFSTLFELIATKSKSLTGTQAELRNFAFCRIVNEFFKKQDVVQYANLTLLKLCTQLSILFMKTFFATSKDAVYLENNRAISDIIDKVLSLVYTTDDKEKYSNFYMEIEKWMSGTICDKDLVEDNCFLTYVENNFTNEPDNENKLFDDNFLIPPFEINAEVTSVSRTLSVDVDGKEEYITQSGNLCSDVNLFENKDCHHELLRSRPKAPGPEENNVYETCSASQEPSDKTSNCDKQTLDTCVVPSNEDQSLILSPEHVDAIDALLHKCRDFFEFAENEKDKMPEESRTTAVDKEVHKTVNEAISSVDISSKPHLPRSSITKPLENLPEDTLMKQQVSIADIDNLLIKCNQFFDFKSKIIEKPTISSSVSERTDTPYVDTPGETPCDQDVSTENLASITDIVSILENCQTYFVKTKELENYLNSSDESKSCLPSTSKEVSKFVNEQQIVDVGGKEEYTSESRSQCSKIVVQNDNTSNSMSQTENVLESFENNRLDNSCKQNDNSSVESFTPPKTTYACEPVSTHPPSFPAPQVPLNLPGPSFIQQNYNPYINYSNHLLQGVMPIQAPIFIPQMSLEPNFNPFHTMSVPLNSGFTGLNPINQGAQPVSQQRVVKKCEKQASRSKVLLHRDPRRHSKYYKSHFLKSGINKEPTSSKTSNKADTKYDSSYRKKLKMKLDNAINYFIKIGSPTNVSKTKPQVSSPVSKDNNEVDATEDAVRKVTGNQSMTTNELLLALEDKTDSPTSSKNSQGKSIFTDSSTDNSEIDIDKLSASIVGDNLLGNCEDRRIYLDEQYTMFDSPCSPDDEQSDSPCLEDALDLTVKMPASSVSKYPSIFSQRIETLDSPLDLSSNIVYSISSSDHSETSEILDLSCKMPDSLSQNTDVSESSSNTGLDLSSTALEGNSSIFSTQLPDIPLKNNLFNLQTLKLTLEAQSLPLSLSLDNKDVPSILNVESYLFANIYQKERAHSLIVKSCKLNRLYMDSVMNLGCLTYCQISASDHLFICHYENCTYYSKEEEFMNHLIEIHKNTQINWDCPICGAKEDRNQNLLGLFAHLRSHSLSISENPIDNNLILTKELEEFIDTSVEDIHNALISLMSHQNPATVDHNELDFEDCLIETYEYLVNPFKCFHKTCMFSTSDIKEYKNHCHLHDSSSTMGSPVCLYCDQTANDPSLHIYHDHGLCYYQCPFCLYRASSEISVAMHQTCHKNSKCSQPVVVQCHKLKPPPTYNELSIKLNPYQCPVEDCFYITYLTDDLIKHLDIHPCNFLLCRDCHARFYCLSDYFKHMVNHFVGKYHCTFCSQCFLKPDAALYHVLMQHKDLTPRVIVRADYASCSDEASKFFNEILPLCIDEEIKIMVIELDSLENAFKYFALVESVKRGRKAGKSFSNHRELKFSFFNSESINVLLVKNDEPSCKEMNTFSAFNAPKRKTVEKYKVIKIKEEVDVEETVYNTSWNPHTCYQDRSDSVEVVYDRSAGPSCSVMTKKPKNMLVQKFVCYLCSEVSSTIGGVDNHFSTSHENTSVLITLYLDDGDIANDSKMFICYFCNISCTEFCDLEQHLKEHKEPGKYCSLALIYICPFCGDHFYNIVALENHCAILHYELYNCDFCDYHHSVNHFNSSSRELIKRLLNSPDRPLICPLAEEGNNFNIESCYIQFRSVFISELKENKIIKKPSKKDKAHRKVSQSKGKTNKPNVSYSKRNLPVPKQNTRLPSVSPNLGMNVQIARKSTTKKVNVLNTGKIGFAKKSTTNKKKQTSSALDDVFPNLRSHYLLNTQPTCSNVSPLDPNAAKSSKAQNLVKDTEDNLTKPNVEGKQEPSNKRSSASLSEASKRARTQTARKSTTMIGGSREVKVAQTARKSTCLGSRFSPSSSIDPSKPGPSGSKLLFNPHRTIPPLNLDQFSHDKLTLMRRPSNQTVGKKISRNIHTNKINICERLHYQPNPETSVPDISLLSFDNITQVCELLSSDE